MENKSNNSIFFLTLSFICIWLVLDNILGKRYLDSFLSSVFPFYNTPTTAKTTVENISEGVAPVVINPTLGANGATGKVLEDYKKKQEEKQNKENNKSDTGKMGLKFSMRM